MTSNLEHDVAPVENVAAFLVSWGLPDKVEQERMSSGLARLQSAVADLHGIFVKAGSENTDAALASGQRVFHSFQELLQSRRVADLVAAQASIVATTLEEASRQSPVLANFAHEVQTCCAFALRESTTQLRGETSAAPTKSTRQTAGATGEQ